MPERSEIADHQPLERQAPAQRREAAGNAPLAAAPHVRALGETAERLNASAASIAQRALGGQLAQGRVKAARQLKRGTPVNDDAGLEREADHMGARAMRAGSAAGHVTAGVTRPLSGDPGATTQLAKADHGAALSKQWYAAQIAATGTEGAVAAAAASNTQGSGVYVSDNEGEWEHRVGVGGPNDIMRVVLPDLAYYKLNADKMPAIMQSNGLTVTQNCELVAEHELVHLRQMSVNLKKTGKTDLTTSAPSFSADKIKKTVEDLIAQTENIEVESGQTVNSSKGKAEYVRERLKYILSTFDKGGGNIEAPTVMRELNRYFQHGQFRDKFKPIIASVKALDEENLASLDLVPKKKGLLDSLKFW